MKNQQDVYYFIGWAIFSGIGIICTLIFTPKTKGYIRNVLDSSIGWIGAGFIWIVLVFGFIIFIIDMCLPKDDDRDFQD